MSFVVTRDTYAKTQNKESQSASIIRKKKGGNNFSLTRDAFCFRRMRALIYSIYSIVYVTYTIDKCVKRNALKNERYNIHISNIDIFAAFMSRLYATAMSNYLKDRSYRYHNILYQYFIF